MAQQLKVSCDGCQYYCNPRPISLEQLEQLIANNPRIADDVFNLKTVKIVCPSNGATLYTKLT